MNHKHIACARMNKSYKIKRFWFESYSHIHFSKKKCTFNRVYFQKYIHFYFFVFHSSYIRTTWLLMCSKWLLDVHHGRSFRIFELRLEICANCLLLCDWSKLAQRIFLLTTAPGSKRCSNDNFRLAQIFT